ncbi:MAG: haloacid dehalogenase type II [Gammaproteobacteria bacterium]|nr:haloacid dehalogenase type II [Gammaproteobacteria bacterium]
MRRDTVLFDINETVLDLRALRPRFREAFGDDAVTATWFSMLLHTSTVCIVTGVKTDFATLAAGMLDALAARVGVELSDTTRSDLLGAFARLPPHADVKPALARLRAAGYRSVAFTNSSLRLVTAQIDNAGLSADFDAIVSVEETGSFKPDARVYAYVAQRLERPLETLRLVATHDWDTHGALTAGMHAAYIDRSAAPYHPLYRRPDVFAATMGDVVEQIIAVDGHA